jgi:toxin ParE1/3/4
MRSSRRLEFTTEGEEDFRSLLAYSLAMWGADQRDAYAERLSAAIHDLLTHPSLGRVRAELRLGLRSHAAGHHTIFYLVDERIVTIVRILHGKMDPRRHLLSPR